MSVFPFDLARKRGARLMPNSLSSPGATERSSKRGPLVLDCPVKPGNDINRVSEIGKCSSGGSEKAQGRCDPPHPEEPCDARRLEGWTLARPCPLPSFETRARACSSGRGRWCQ